MLMRKRNKKSDKAVQVSKGVSDDSSQDHKIRVYEIVMGVDSSYVVDETTADAAYFRRRIVLTLWEPFISPTTFGTTIYLSILDTSRTITKESMTYPEALHAETSLADAQYAQVCRHIICIYFRCTRDSANALSQVLGCTTTTLGFCCHASVYIGVIMIVVPVCFCCVFSVTRSKIST